MTSASSTGLEVHPSPTLRSEKPAALQCAGLSKRFPAHRGLRQALRHPFQRDWVQSLTDVSFTVRQGELFGVLGPNGAGKTTLFRCITSLVSPESGTVSVYGQDVARSPRAARARLGVVFATERAMNWRLDARSNLRLFAALYNIPADDVEGRIDAVLKRVELDDTGTRLAGTFSSGMKQRLSLARALLTNPPLLLLDEPTRSLDPVSAQRFREFLRQEVAEGDRTVVLATHNTEEAFGLCDRAVVLDRGHVIATDSAARLAERFDDHVYRVWTRTPQHRALVAAGARPAAVDDPQQEWRVVELSTVSTDEEASALLRVLLDDGVSVSRFERVGISLGDLLQRMIAQQPGGAR